MSTVLSEYLNKKVSIITTDGRLYIGILEGYDHSVNLVLRKASQVFISPDSTKLEYMGLFFIRGDCVGTIGRISPKLERRLDWDNIKGKHLKRIR